MNTYYSAHTSRVESLGVTGFKLKTIGSSLLRGDPLQFSDDLDEAIKGTDINITREMIKRNTNRRFRMFNLVHKDEVRGGSVKDCVYFIFRDTRLMKIGKVGGGKRCVRARASDYRSRDSTAKKISSALNEPINKLVHMYYIDFTKVDMNVYGIKDLEPVLGPSLEKRLISKAQSIGLTLPWNKNKG